MCSTYSHCRSGTVLLHSLGSSVLLCGSQLWPGLCNTPITFHPQLTQQNIDYTNTHATDYCACFNRGPFGPECVFKVDYSCVCDGLFLHVQRSRSLDAALAVSVTDITHCELMFVCTAVAAGGAARRPGQQRKGHCRRNGSKRGTGEAEGEGGGETEGGDGESEGGDQRFATG